MASSLAEDIAAGEALIKAHAPSAAANDADVMAGEKLLSEFKPAANDAAPVSSREAYYANTNPLSRANAALTELVQPVNARIGQALAPAQVGADPASLPESAAAMRPTGAPSAPVDAASTFERLGALRKKLLAEGKRPETDAEYVGLLRDQAAGVAQNDRAAATFLAPAVPGAGIAGRVAAVAERAPNFLQLAPAETRAITNPLPIAPLEAPDALTSAMLDRLNEAGIRPSRPSAFPDNQLIRSLPAPTETPLPPVAAQAIPVAPASAAPVEPPAANRLTAQPEPVAAQPAANPLAPEAPPGMGVVTPTEAPKARLLPGRTLEQADAEADKIIRHFAGNGNTTINTTAQIPGSQRSLARAIEGGNPGIAALERRISETAPHSNDFVALDRANEAARADFYHSIAGTPADIAALEAERAAATAANERAAFAKTSPVDPTPVVERIDQILSGREGQRDAIKSALENVRKKLVKEDGTLQTNPDLLYGVRKSINDSIAPKAAGTANDARQAAHELMDVKAALDPVIESGAPGFTKFIKDYEERSRPIDGMTFLQNMKLTDAQGKIQLGRLNTAIDALERQQKSPGAKLADSVTPEQLAALKTLREDFRNDARRKEGSAIGSPTVQNLGTNRAMDALGHPLVGAAGFTGAFHSPFLAIPALGARMALDKAGQRWQMMVQDALRRKLLNPEDARSAFQPGSR